MAELSELRVGQRVRYEYSAGAITCCTNGGRLRGEGVIAEIRDFEYEPGVGVGRRWVFPEEIVEIIDEPESATKAA